MDRRLRDPAAFVGRMYDRNYKSDTASLTPGRPDSIVVRELTESETQSNIYCGLAANMSI